MHLLLQGESTFGVGAGDGLRRVDAVARFHFLHAFAHRFDDTRAIGTRCVGKWRFYCIGTRTHVGVIRIHASGVDSDDDLSGGGLRCRDFFELENFGAPEFTNQNGFHCLSPRCKVTKHKQRNAVKTATLQNVQM
jgi:hypothetical protein